MENKKIINTILVEHLEELKKEEKKSCCKKI